MLKGLCVYVRDDGSLPKGRYIGFTPPAGMRCMRWFPLLSLQTIIMGYQLVHGRYAVACCKMSDPSLLRDVFFG